MPVTGATTRNDYVATSGQNVFNYTFQILLRSDLKVLKNGVALTLNNDYTVAIIGQSGGFVTLSAPASAGDTVNLFLAMPIDRTTEYQNAGDFLASDVNGDFDKGYIAMNQLQTDIARSMGLKDYDPSVDMTLPVASSRANKFLKFNSQGRPVVDIGIPINNFTDSDNVTYTPAGTWAVATNVQEKLRETVSVKDFGAVGDGVTDDSSAIQAAIDSALSVLFPPATYLCSNVNVPSNRTLIGEGATLFTNGTSAILSAIGVLGTLTLLTSDANSGDEFFSTTSASGFVEGGGYWLQAEDEPLDIPGNKSGEVGTVSSVSGLNINVESVVSGSYLTSDTAYAAPITFVENVTIKGLTFINGTYRDAPTSATNSLVQCVFTKNVKVINCSFNENNSAGIKFYNAIDCVVKSNSFYRMRDDTPNGIFGYGVSIINACSTITVSGNSFRKCRHGVTTGNVSSGVTPDYGVSRAITMSANTASGCSQAAYDTHEDSDGVVITGNTVDNFSLVGIQTRSINTSITGNTVTNGKGNGIYIRSFATGSVVSGNVVRNVGYVSASSSGYGIRADADSLVITGNHVSYCDHHGIVAQANSNNVVSISNNQSVNNGQTQSASSGLQIDANVNRLSIVGNVFADSQVTKTQDYGIRLASQNISEAIVVSSNLLDGNQTADYSNAGTASPASLGNAGGDVTGHTVRVKTLTGTLAAGASAVVTCTFPYNLSVGADYTTVSTCTGQNVTVVGTITQAAGQVTVKVRNDDASPQEGTINTIVIVD